MTSTLELILCFETDIKPQLSLFCSPQTQKNSKMSFSQRSVKNIKSPIKIFQFPFSSQTCMAWVDETEKKNTSQTPSCKKKERDIIPLN